MKQARTTEIAIFIILIIFSCSLILLDKLNLLNFIKRPLEKVVIQIRLTISQTFNNKLNSFHTLSQEIILNQKIKDLELEQANLNIKINSLEKENQAMKKLLGAPLSPKWKFIPAKVLNINNGVITIALGQDGGISDKQIVIANNHLIGQVVQATPGQAKIMLLTNKDFQVKAKILTTNAKAVVKGSLNNLIILDMVLQEIPLSVDQVIVSSGEDGVFPPDLIIGKISSIEKNPTAVYQKAIIQPLINLKDLEEVFIIKNYP